MREKSTLLDTLMHSIYEQTCEEIIGTIRARIQEVRIDLEHLWQQQLVIEHEHATHLQGFFKHCA